MYESYYGFVEKPFSLTPDPKFLYRSPSHSGAFELLQYAIHRREGFVVITGDIGTGKTTLCRALLEEIDRTTYTALVLNPFLSEEDLLKRILQDFGVVSREEVKGGALAGVSKQQLIDALYDFLLGLVPLKASAVLIIDEAQNLPLSVLEQIRILSNLETDKEKLLQIILVGQLNLQSLLRSPELRQLDQRVSIRYQLEPLDRDGVSGYVAHRLAIAGGSGAVSFTHKALEMVHRLTNGIPRLINLICDRALLSGFSERTNRITPEMVAHAAQSLEVQPSQPRFRWLARRASPLAGAAVVLLASAFAVGASAFLYQRLTGGSPASHVASAVPSADRARFASAPWSASRQLPAEASLTILVGAYPIATPQFDADIRSMTEWLEASGFHVYYSPIDSGSGQRWQRVLAGAYTDERTARMDADRLKRAAPSVDARVVTTETAGRAAATSAAEPEIVLRRAGIDP
jgi:type II secretory pathway predicted ATPase ExeA